MQQGKTLNYWGHRYAVHLKCWFSSGDSFIGAKCFPHQHQKHRITGWFCHGPVLKTLSTTMGAAAATSCITSGFYSTCGGGGQSSGFSGSERITCQPADSCRQTEAALLEEGRGEITRLQPRSFIPHSVWAGDEDVNETRGHGSSVQTKQIIETVFSSSYRAEHGRVHISLYIIGPSHQQIEN